MSEPFRNVLGSAGQPVEQWPYEALVAAIERGTLGDWIPIIRAIQQAPWGLVARQVEDYLGYAQPYGVAPLLRSTIERARTAAEASERQAAAARVRDLVARSGLSREEFASRIGTSRSRLSTYCTGRVTPSAALLIRMERVADRAGPRT